MVLGGGFWGTQALALDSDPAAGAPGARPVSRTGGTGMTADVPSVPALNQTEVLGTYRVDDIRSDVRKAGRFRSECKNVRNTEDAHRSCGKLVWVIRRQGKLALIDADQAASQMERRSGLSRLSTFALTGPNCRYSVSMTTARQDFFSSGICSAALATAEEIRTQRALRRRLSRQETRDNDIFYLDPDVDPAVTGTAMAISGAMVLGTSDEYYRVIVPKNENQPERIRIMEYDKSQGLAILVIPYSITVQTDFDLVRVGD